MNKFFIKFSLLLAIVFLFSAPAQAGNQASEDLFHIKANEIITKNVSTISDEIIIDGIINGDLIAMASKITINGQIEGDLLALASEIYINGPIGGNVRVISNYFELSSTISRNLNVFGDNVKLTENSRVLWDTNIWGADSTIEGRLEGSLKVLAYNVFISGEINDDVEIKLYANKKKPGHISLSGANIGGDLHYRATNNAEIDDASNIDGQVYATLIQPEKNHLIPRISWGNLIYKIISALIFGFLIILLGRKYLPKLQAHIKNTPKKLILPGLIIFFGTPLATIILFITIIGIPLSLATLAIWTIVQYLAKILMMILFGQWIIKFFRKEKPFHIAWALALGVVISYLLFSLPFIGWLLSLLASLAGLGAIYLYVKNKS
jgi:cytoskeletal protein CcmA (bactofilin family)